MLVKNLIGTTKCEPSEGSWIDLWEKKKNVKDAPCYNTSVHRGERVKAKVGGHVCNAIDSKDKSCYIVPLCTKCNLLERPIPFTVDYSLLLKLPPLERCVVDGNVVCKHRSRGTCRLEEYLAAQ